MHVVGHDHVGVELVVHQFPFAVVNGASDELGHLVLPQPTGAVPSFVQITVDPNESPSAGETQAAQEPSPAPGGKILPASVRTAKAVPPEPAPPLQVPATPPATGTVVLDVEGGVVVPSLIGKPLREAVEVAQESGFELEVIGSGVARAQAPPPGTRIRSEERRVGKECRL